METYQDVCQYLYTLPSFDQTPMANHKLGLETIYSLLDAVGNPHLAYPTVHVAGTNGKGSTSSMLAAISTASGRKTGLHTSPHLWDFSERMRIDGVPAPKDWITQTTISIKPVIAELRPSFFEVCVALTFLYFAESGVDLAVIEVGLGGRLDATNVVEPRLSLITSIGKDHTNYLGDTYPAIAREKAGIVKPGIPIMTTVTRPTVLKVFRSVCRRMNSELMVFERDDPPFSNLPPLSLNGHHQEANAVLASEAARFLFPDDVNIDEAIEKGLADTRKLTGIRGRCEVLSTSPLIIADVAHNLESLSACLDFINEQFQGQRLNVIFGVMRDKPYAKMAALLADHDARVVPVQYDSPRALDADRLRDALASAGCTLVEAPDVAAGFEWFDENKQDEDLLLITGSHYIVAEVPEAWR